MEMVRNIRWSIVCLFFLVLTSCEYEMDKEYHVDINPPPASHAFNLNLISVGDTIKVFNETTLSYSVNTFGLKLLKGSLYLNELEYGIYSDEGSVNIYPRNFVPGYYPLTMNITTNSGTGSIADGVGAEGYVVQRKWIVLVDNRLAPRPVITRSITKEGFLKWSWSKCEQYNFKSYFISVRPSFSESIHKPIYDADSCYYVDSSCFGAGSYIHVSTSVETENSSQWSEMYLNESLPRLVFTDKGADSVIVSWPKSPYNATYKLTQKGMLTADKIWISNSDTSVTVRYPGLWERVTFDLRMAPYHVTSENSWASCDYANYELGEDFYTNSVEFGYNKMENILYTNWYSDIMAYDVKTMNKLTAVKPFYLGNNSMFSCPTNSSEMAVLLYNNIYVYPDKSLQNPIVIPYSIGGKNVDHFFFSDNEFIAVALDNRYDLISIAEKKVVASISIADYPAANKWLKIKSSYDAKHACFLSEVGANLYSIENGVISKINTDSRVLTSAAFNPIEPNQLLVTLAGSNVLEVRDASDFSLIKTIELSSEQVIQNIDPKSGWVLLSSDNEVAVMDIINSRYIFKAACACKDVKLKLFGGRLFSEWGQSLDISKYIKQ